MYELIKTTCICHPETCCCEDYQILLDGKAVAKTSDYFAGLSLVQRANASKPEPMFSID